MKRAQQEEEKCRRQELKCKLYDIIKDLERASRSECGYSKPPPVNHGGAFNQNNGMEKKRKGSECCCPPGCCQQSLEFRMPRLLPKEDPYNPQDQGSQDPEATGSDYQWHNEDHSWGCRPEGEGGPGSHRGRISGAEAGSPGYNPGVSPGGGCCSYSPYVGGGSPVSPASGGGFAYNPNVNYNQNPSPKTFQFPQSPEEAIRMGCVVARTA